MYQARDTSRIRLREPMYHPIPHATALALLFFFASFTTLAARAQNPASTSSCDLVCKKWPDSELKQKYAVVEIDANTGEITEGGTRYSEGEKILLVFVKKNPFNPHFLFEG